MIRRVDELQHRGKAKPSSFTQLKKVLFSLKSAQSVGIGDTLKPFGSRSDTMETDFCSVRKLLPHSTEPADQNALQVQPTLVVWHPPSIDRKIAKTTNRRLFRPRKATEGALAASPGRELQKVSAT